LMTLWGTQGSRVIRGNLLVIPLADSIIYVEPLYLEAEDTGLPELRKVIVVYGTAIQLGDTLDQALANLFGEMPAVSAETAAAEEGQEPTRVIPSGELSQVRDIITRLLALDQEKRQALAAGDLATYQEKDREQSDLLKQLQDAVK
ncbi:MAG TPA: UPF0182 family protein, partial [Armatimonadota bacterium]|nr:UPF0182 family protein [Armatimonadota bacterium]